ncbi:ABC transporter substrate-binding protein [Duganella sp. BJB476]|nr:ABC transporter substrate-binding protein [Duganella sp. BJB476]
MSYSDLELNINFVNAAAIERGVDGTVFLMPREEYTFDSPGTAIRMPELVRRERMWRAILVTLTVLLMTRQASSLAAEIVFVAPANHAMPLMQFEEGQLKSGILKDLGDAFAKRLGVEARYITVPSKRVSMVLQRGEADCLCYVLPGWLDGEFDWSHPIMSDGGVLVARADAPRINTLNDLADQRVGTVSGYRYPQLVDALGPRFLRDDGPTAEHSLRKLMAGRSQYAIVEELMAGYQMRIDPRHQLRIDLVVSRFHARCAFSRRAKLGAARMNHALDSLIDDGSIERIVARYRDATP